MESVFLNVIVVEFLTVRHLVERLAEIKQNDVYLMTESELEKNLIDSDYMGWDSQERLRRNPC